MLTHPCWKVKHEIQQQHGMWSRVFHTQALKSHYLHQPGHYLEWGGDSRSHWGELPLSEATLVNFLTEQNWKAEPDHQLITAMYVWLFVTPWTVARQTPLSLEFSRQEYWSGLPCPPQGIFLTQGLNLHLLHLHNCRQILYHWATREARLQSTDF